MKKDLRCINVYNQFQSIYIYIIIFIIIIIIIIIHFISFHHNGLLYSRYLKITKIIKLVNQSQSQQW